MKNLLLVCFLSVLALSLSCGSKNLRDCKSKCGTEYSECIGNLAGMGSSPEAREKCLQESKECNKACEEQYKK